MRRTDFVFGWIHLLVSPVSSAFIGTSVVSSSSFGHESPPSRSRLWQRHFRNRERINAGQCQLRNYDPVHENCFPSLFRMAGKQLWRGRRYSNPTIAGRTTTTTTTTTSCYQSLSNDSPKEEGSSDNDNDNDNDNSKSSDVESMRRLLEASWNNDQMGQVPSTPELAAEAAATSIASAIQNDKNILLVDILLPSYDITQGPNMYDDVLAVEFCIALAKCMQAVEGNSNSSGGGAPEKSAVFVRDDRALRNVERVLNVKEKERTEEAQREYEAALEEYENEDDKEDEEEEDDAESNEDSGISSDGGDVVEFYDDFADFGGIAGGTVGMPEVTSDESGTSKENSVGTDKNEGEGDTFIDDVDLFRKQLMSSWESDVAPPNDSAAASDTGSSTLSSSESSFSSSKTSDISKQKKGKKKKRQARADRPPPPPPPPPVITEHRAYRLGSLLGNVDISAGADMFGDVVKAVASNVNPEDDEDTLIILSAVTREEMIGVRSVVAKYGTSKKIILVNCKLDPIPRELIGSETVYSILPLIARSKVSDTNIFGNRSGGDGSVDDNKTSPKIVVMRRYPRDWEVFVDLNGSGFELVDSAPAEQVGKKGPPMEWIASCVKRHMDFKFGRS